LREGRALVVLVMLLLVLHLSAEILHPVVAEEERRFWEVHLEAARKLVEVVVLEKIARWRERRRGVSRRE
jgi:hypothetical protein